jgi:hypothetical protein
MPGEAETGKGEVRMVRITAAVNAKETTRRLAVDDMFFILAPFNLLYLAAMTMWKFKEKNL